MLIKRKVLLFTLVIHSIYIGQANADVSDGYFWVGYGYQHHGISATPEPLAQKICNQEADAYTYVTGIPWTVSFIHTSKFYPGLDLSWDGYTFGCRVGTETGGWWSAPDKFRLSKEAPAPEPAPEVTYNLKITPITTQAYGSYITSIEPQLPVRLLLSVKDSKGNPANIPVDIEVTVIEGTGGHIQEHHEERNPTHAGIIKVGNIKGQSLKNIGIDEIQEFEFKSPEKLAGDYVIKLTCPKHKCTHIGADSIWSGVKGLTLLPDSSVYNKIGDTQHHPLNHYGTKLTLQKIKNIATSYREIFPDDNILHINDISLNRGGLFDAVSKWVSKAKWTPPHSTHMKGTDIDVRSNEFQGATNGAIPLDNYVDFENIADVFGCRARIHSGTTANEHYHLYCR